MPTPLQLDLAWLAAATPLMTDAYWEARGALASKDAGTGVGVDAAVEVVPQVGRWFERVHLASLRAAPDVEVLAANEALGGHGRTLGELDVLYRRDGCVVHREVAVKYYLAAGAGRDPSRWIGPGRRDRLDLKLNRLATHQLVLPSLAREAGVWPAVLPFPDRSEALLLGAWFSPPDDPRIPEGAREDAEHGRWYFASDFAARFGDDPWRVLDKPWWLSPEHARRAAPVPARTLARDLDGPRLVARVAEDIERALVVPDQWVSPSSFASARSTALT